MACGYLHEFGNGVDCVAGYIDAIPAEYIGLGGDFLSRGRLEDTYLRYIAEIYARCDPRPHDPWPNHRVSSGASLARDSWRHIQQSAACRRALSAKIRR